MFNRGDKVKVKNTGAEEKVTNVSDKLWPPIWLTDGRGYVSTELELLEAAPVPRGKIRVERTCVYSMQIETDDPQEAKDRAMTFTMDQWDEEWGQVKVAGQEDA